MSELTERDDIHAALNTYEVQADTYPGVHRTKHDVSVIGDNRRRLIVRDQPDGVWIGGCLIADAGDVAHLAEWLAKAAARMRGEDDEMPRGWLNEHIERHVSSGPVPGCTFCPTAGGE